MKKNKGIIIVAAFALMILGALAVARWYQLKYVTRLPEEVYVIRDANVAKNLLRGTKPDNPSSELYKVEAYEPVYQRGKSLYVGEEKEKVEAAFPFLANDSTAMMLIKDDPALLDTGFEEVSTFRGMYISDGLSFNYDKSQADDESYLFLKLSNGLFMNAQPIRFDYPGGQEKVRMNSIFCFERNAVRFYGVQPEHSLWYGELPTVNMLMVTIGGKTYSYEQFLGLLGLAGKDYKPSVTNAGNSSVSPGTGEPEQEEPEAESSPEMQEEMHELSEAEKQQADKADKEAIDKTEEEDSRQKDNEDLSESEKQKKEKPKKEKKNKDNGTTGESGGGNSNSNSSGTSSGKGTGNSNDNKGSTGSTKPAPDVSGDDLSGNDVSGGDISGNLPGFVRPDVSLEDFTADIYSISSSLTINDPSYVVKRVVIELYWQSTDENGKPAQNSDDRDKYELKYRRTFRSGGDIELDNLPPDTWIYAKAIVYYMQNGETENYEFYDGFEARVHTKPMDTLDDIYLMFESSKGDVKMLPHQMQIFDLTASGPNPNVLNKVSRVEISVTGTDAVHKNQTFSCQMNISDFRNKYCYAGGPEMEPAESDDGEEGDVSGSDVSGNDTGVGGEDGNDTEGGDEVKPGLDWVSVREAMELPSNMEFDYEIKLMDSFGNVFTRVVNGYHGKARKSADGEEIDWNTDKRLDCCEKEDNYYGSIKGSSYTSKTEPTIVMKQVKFTDGEKDIDRAKYEITMLDPDGAAANFKQNYYMELYLEDENGLISETAKPVECYYQVSGGTNAKTKTDRFYLTEENIENGGIVQYELTELTAGQIYELRIYGNYELNDQINAGADAASPCLINSQRFSTADLSSLGSIMYTLTNTHVKTDVWPDGKKYAEEGDETKNQISPYESATAQELSMQINYGYNMTNSRLAGLISELIVEVTDTTKEGDDAIVMRAVLDRDKLAKTVLTGTGDLGSEKRFELDLADLLIDGTPVESALKNADGTPYIPKLYLETGDVAEGSEINAWDVFAGETTKAKLVFFWEDGSLNSNTAYQLNVQTLARQGGMDHDVTAKGAAYRRLNFTTLKKMPYVTWDSILIVSDYIKIQGLNFHDEDSSILEGVVQQNLYGITNGNAYSIESGSNKLTYPAAGGEGIYGLLDLLHYSGMVIGDTYRVDIAPTTIRRDSAGRYTLRQRNLFSYEFTAGAGLSGRLVFESIDYPLVKNADGTQYRRDEFRLYNAGGYSMGYSFNSDGTVTDTLNNASNRWSVSPFIPVKPGGIYYIDGTRGNSTTTTMGIEFYTDKNEPDENTTVSALIDRDTWKVAGTGSTRNSRLFYISPSDNVIRIPESSDGGEIRYMRFNMYGYDTATSISAYATADCFVLDDGEKKVDGAVEKIDVVFEKVSAATNNYQYTSTEIAVNEGEKYVVNHGVNRIDYYFYDGSGAEIATTNSTSYDFASSVREVPKGAVKMKIMTGNSSNYRGGETLELYKLNTEKLEWLRSRDIDKFANSLTVNVEDKLNNLVLEKNREVSLKVWQIDGEKETEVPLDCGRMEMQVTADQLSTLDFSQLVSFDGKSNKKFRMELSVNYNGEKIILDSMEFETNRTLECIHDRTELAKLMRYPAGDFIVVNDIALRDNEGFYFGNGSNPFRGTLDFQGHSLTVNGTWTGITTLEAGGVVKNLSLHSRLQGTVGSNRGLTETNRGTIQNVVLELDLGQGMYRKNYVGGLCYNNYGTIENFSVYYTATSSMYVGRNFGGLCRENYGVVKNGYVYCPATLSVTTAVYGGTYASDYTCETTSLLTSISYGDVRNVYVVGDLSVERYTEAGTLPYNALLTRNSGTVNNCISVGDMYRILWTEGSGNKTRLKEAYTPYGPIVAGNTAADSTAVRNNYYYSYIAKPYTNNYKGVQEQVTDAALFQDATFYDRTVNSEDAFQVSDIVNGYFPRVKMPYDELMMQQQKAPLVTAGVDVSTSYAYATVDEIVRQDINGEAQDYALATLTFRNRLGRTINAVTIDGLIVEPQDGRNEFEQYADGGYYRVKVKLSVDKYRKNDKDELEVLYRKKYDVTGFTYNSTYNAVVKNRQIEVTFPRLVTQDNWVIRYDTAKKRWLTVFEDMEGCYRLGTDIDYTKFSASTVSGITGNTPKTERQAAMEVFTRRADNKTTFYGSLDGMDAKGKIHTLKNFSLGKDRSSYVYLIDIMRGGELKNLIVENLAIDQDGLSQTYCGLVGRSYVNSRFENIVMKDVRIDNIYRYTGALAGEASYTTVQDCVLKGFSAESRSSAATDFRIGGFIGSAGGATHIDNCYAAGVGIKAMKGTSGSGAGALIGVGGTGAYSTWIQNCYAQGKIESNMMYTGGLVGQGAVITNIWSKVNVNSSNRYTGGISGLNSTIKNTLVLGDIYCTAPDSYNRVSSGSAKLASCYASELQKVNSKADSTDSGDAEGIMTVEEMKREFWYWDKLNMGSAFDYSVVEDGHLPLLKYKDGHANLPLQDLFVIEPESVPFTAEGLAEDNFDPAWADGITAISGKVHEYDLSVTLRFRYAADKDPKYKEAAFKNLFKGADGTAYGKLSIEDMEFVKNAGGAIQETAYSYDPAEHTYSLTFKVTPKRYLDSYRVVWDTGVDQESAILVFQKEEDGEKKDTSLYRHIYRVEDNDEAAAEYQKLTGSEGSLGTWADPNSWQGAMRLADEFENFLIMENLNFTNVKAPGTAGVDDKLILKTGLRINRLEGVNQSLDMDGEGLTEWDRKEYLMRDNLESTEAEKFITISNLNFEKTDTAGENWIYELRAGMKYLRFRKITWTGSGSYTGVVRYQRGSLSYIDIDGFALKYKNTGDYMGFFTGSNDGRATGSVNYLRVRDIVLERLDPDTNTLGASSYVGGIFGYTNALVQHVGIKGKAPAEGVDREERTNWSYRIEGRLPNLEDTNNKSYTGGLGGYMVGSGLIFVYAENIFVEGNGTVGAITGSQNSYGSYTEAMFKAVQTEGREPLYLQEAKNCSVTGKNYAGGISGGGGTRWSLSERNTVHAVNVRAGGISGSAHGQYNKVVDCVITADVSHAGGLCSNGNQHFNLSEVQGCVISAPKYAGGLAAAGDGNGSYYGGAVHDCIIYGDEYVGGAVGFGDNSYSLFNNSTYVGNCYIGSQGESNMPELVKKADGTYTINEKVTDSDKQKAAAATAKYVGGVVGYSCGGRLQNVLVDDDVHIYGAQFVGGIIGAGGGGGTLTDVGSSNIESGATVYVGDCYGGGYAGQLIGYEQSSRGPDILSRPVTKIDRVIIAGKVVGSGSSSYIGGFVGVYRAGKESLNGTSVSGRPLDPEEGFERNDLDTGYRAYMSGSNILRVTLALTEVSGGTSHVEVIGSAGATGAETPIDQNKKERLEKLANDGTIEKEANEITGIGYLRVYGSMPVNGAKASTKYNWDFWQYYPGGDMPEEENARFVTTAGLRTIDFYYAPLSRGGQEMRNLGETNSRTYYSNNNIETPYNFRNFIYENKGTLESPTTDVFPYMAISNSSTTRLYIYEWKSDNDTQKQCQKGIPIPEDGINTTFLDISEALDHVSTYASGAGSVNLEFPEILVTEETAGEEGIMLMSPEDETMQSVKASAGAAKTVSKSRASAKAAAGIMTMADMEENAEDTSAEETEEVITPVSYFQIYDGNGELLYEDRIGKQVYTIPYDYEETLTLKVYAGAETRSYMLTGETLQHTVMTWDDHCYYLKSDGIYRDRGVYTDDGSGDEKDYANTEKVRSGAFLHLYQGEALDGEGNIIDVVSGKRTEKLDTEALYVPAEEETPAYETSYGGEKILTYRTFSTTRDEEVVSDYRLFAHNDKLFGMDPELDQPYGQKFWNFVADYYSTSKGSAEYLSVLNENYVLEDHKTALNWPVEEGSGKKVLRNYQIREVGDNLNADKSYVIIRYYDNTAAAFDYLTGSLLFVDDSEKKQLDFMEYANMWLLGRKESLNSANAYLGAKGLVEKLSENPVDDDLVAAYVENQTTKGGKADADEERTDLAIDGTNGVGGSSMLSGVDNGNLSLGANAPAKRSETAESIQNAGSSAIGNTTGNGSGNKAQDNVPANEITSGMAEGDGTGIIFDTIVDIATGNTPENAENGTAGNGIGKGDLEAAGDGAGAGACEGTGTGLGTETGTEAGLKEGTGTGAAKIEKKPAGTGGNAITEGMADGEEIGVKSGSDKNDGSLEKTDGAEAGAMPDPTSDRAYVTMLTAEAGGYEVFRAAELLSKRGSVVMSENQKLKLLEANGLLQNAGELESMRLTSEENRTGLALVGTASVAMLLLLGLLYYKKRKMSRFM